MARELKYHEQSEGWKHEWLADRHCVCIMRPYELGGGFVTIDFERRIFNVGHSKPRQGASTTAYGGRGRRVTGSTAITETPHSASGTPLPTSVTAGAPGAGATITPSRSSRARSPWSRVGLRPTPPQTNSTASAMP